MVKSSCEAGLLQTLITTMGLGIELASFTRAFLSHWQSYATGGVITGVINVVERLFGKQLSGRIYVLIFIITFSLVAFFMTWRDQFERAENAEAKLRGKNEPAIQVNIPPITVPPAQVIVPKQPASLNTSKLDTSDDDPILFLGCDRLMLPIAVPEGRLTILDPQLPAGLAQITVGLDQNGRWPQGVRLGVSIYRCELVNYWTRPIFVVQVAFQVMMREVIRTDDGRGTTGMSTGKVTRLQNHPADIPELAGNGSKFTFYIYNGSPEWADLVAYDVASFETGESNQRRTVKIKRSPSGTSPGTTISIPPLQ